MQNHFRRPLALSLLRPIALVAALCALVGACGSTVGPTLAQSANEAAIPTAVPTTPPLSLPAADPSLPALAPVPETIGVAPAASTSPATTAPSTAESSSANEQMGTAVVVGSTDSWSTCVVTAAEATGALAVLDAIAATTATDLSSVQLNSFAAAAASCDLVSITLGSTDLADHVPAAASCLDAWLASSGGGSVLVGLVSAGWGQATPAWAQPQFIDALDSCFAGTSFAAEVMSVVATNASLIGAFDSGCLAASFDASDTLRNYAQQLANAPRSAMLNVGLSDAWVLSCANVGQMVAAAASAEGVSLSAATITCIDSGLKNSGAVAQLVSGTADTGAIGLATIACLTPAEATAILG